jgi:hypothetical protein
MFISLFSTTVGSSDEVLPSSGSPEDWQTIRRLT